jgi:hypothetical protein
MQRQCGKELDGKELKICEQLSTIEALHNYYSASAISWLCRRKGGDFPCAFASALATLAED